MDTLLLRKRNHLCLKVLLNNISFVLLVLLSLPVGCGKHLISATEYLADFVLAAQVIPTSTSYKEATSPINIDNRKR